MQQARDFLEESEVLHAAVAHLSGSDWDRKTQFKGWTLNDVFVHLHFWNEMADLSLAAPDDFAERIERTMAEIGARGIRATENAAVALRGEALREAWRARCIDMARRWEGLDPKARVGWVGPEMSVRSSMTARQMETWAHGQAVFDLLGAERRETDRIRNIVVLGVNTFGWSFRVHGREVPPTMPRLELVAPSGAQWRLGEENATDLIRGSAVAFAQVVTQTRNIADTQLEVEGPVAAEWMRIAQCFAGGPEMPPPPGTRFRRSV